ncbi:O-methyltransferase-domain-containing protein [Lentinula aff. detonsa]|uniref:O-methyltransferase-domain-containing protein n=1 Tax=Lentinula aff. detonsa TaxID=2804958 RepID=A0AA38KHE8_9AGAR|nr:O-methyltransferase-domain-containing protein [Lentinula aff. detonsa]
MPSTLRSLLSIIQKSVDDIEATFEKRGFDFPSLDEPPSERDSIRLEPSVQAATALLTSAAYQLIANVQLPPSYIFNSLFGYYLPSALRAAMETNIVEILREAGPQGMHVREIAKKAQVDPTKISSILCYLATYHIFREIEPDVYANNRLSSVWDTEKSLEEIKERQVLSRMTSLKLLTTVADSPMAKFNSTNGIAALIGHCADEDYKGAGQIADHIMTPETAFEDSPERSPLMTALGYDKGSMWSWFEEPSNEMRLRRFGIAMNGVNSLQPPDAILKGFDWASLPEGSVIVDVGGGIGVSSISIVRAFGHLKCIVQDRAMVLKLGTEHCQKLLPDALSSGKIEYHEHDFFDVQPQTSATVFLLKQITHDWSDRYVTRILQRLRDAATPTTMLVIVDTIINHPCPSPPSNILGANLPPPPPPLLANLGVANASTHFADLSMFVHFNAQERTLAHMVELLAGTGWEVIRVYRSDDSGGYLPQIVATPVPSPALVKE